MSTFFGGGDDASMQIPVQMLCIYLYVYKLCVTHVSDAKGSQTTDGGSSGNQWNVCAHVYNSGVSLHCVPCRLQIGGGFVVYVTHKSRYRARRVCRRCV